MSGNTDDIADDADEWVIELPDGQQINASDDPEDPDLTDATVGGNGSNPPKTDPEDVDERG